MNADRRNSDVGNNGNDDIRCSTDALLCWGCGEHGQNASLERDDVEAGQGHVTVLSGGGGGASSDGRIKFAACGSSHTVVVTRE